MEVTALKWLRVNSTLGTVTTENYPVFQFELPYSDSCCMESTHQAFFQTLRNIPEQAAGAHGRLQRSA